MKWKKNTELNNITAKSFHKAVVLEKQTLTTIVQMQCLSKDKIKSSRAKGGQTTTRDLKNQIINDIYNETFGLCVLIFVTTT